MTTLDQLDINKDRNFHSELSLLENTIEALGLLENDENKALHDSVIGSLEMLHDYATPFEQMSLNAALANLKAVGLINDRKLITEQYRIARRYLEILHTRKTDL